MNQELEAALTILNAALGQEQWPLNETKRKALVDLRNELLHFDHLQPSANQRKAVLLAQAALLQDIGSLPSLQPMRPPVNAEFLFHLFVTPLNCDALVGDLEERYKLIRKKFGRRRANFWYWTQTVMSLGPIVWAWGKRFVMKPIIAIAGWAVAKGLIGHDGWLAAMVELWKRVRS